MNIEERFEVKAPRERVWAMLRDPLVIGPCIPGCEHIETVSDTFYKATLNVTIGPIKAKFELDVEIVDEQPPQEMVSRMRGEEGSRASLLQATNVVRLAEIDTDATDVYYSSDVALTGRLGRFGLGMMRKTTARLANQFAEALQARAQASSETR